MIFLLVVAALVLWFLVANAKEEAKRLARLDGFVITGDSESNEYEFLRKKMPDFAGHSIKHYRRMKKQMPDYVEETLAVFGYPPSLQQDPPP